MTAPQQPPRKEPPFFAVVATSPRLLDKHSEFMAAGGDRLLAALVETVQPGMWPWDKPPENTAQFGAFLAGIAWTTNVMRNLVTLVNNRKVMGDLVATAVGSAATPAQLREILLAHGYQKEDLPAELRV